MKRKTGRNPLQRLSDQRRSLALVGLAVGAVFSAAILRRKRHGGERMPGSRFHRAAAAQPDFGPPAAVPVPGPRRDRAQPPAAPPATPEPPVEAASSATVEPATAN